MACSNRSRPRPTVVDAVCRAAGALEIRLARDGRRARAAVGGAQGRRQRDGPHRAELLPARRRRAAHASCPRSWPTSVEIGERYDLPIANLFHAGDGNLHPMILFDAREPGILRSGRWRPAARS